MAKAKVSHGWKYAAIALTAVVVGQFFWWDDKCPDVLRGKNGKKGY